MTTTRRTGGLTLWAQTGWVSKRARFTLVITGILLLLGMCTPQRAEAQVESVIHNFPDGPSDGVEPYAGLVRDSSGNLYGTTTTGGASDAGIVFKLDASGALTVLHSFSGGTDDGATPNGGLVMDSSGNLYGTTTTGGASDAGTVFKLDASGTLAVLHSFSGGTNDGAKPYEGLVMDPSGNLYGTTVEGGSSSYQCFVGCGTVFELVNSSGSYTERVLHSFSYFDGAYPHGVLVRDTSGNLYGTTVKGGSPTVEPHSPPPEQDGTVFKLDPSGTLTVLYSFSGSDGSYPVGRLVRDTSGNLYGTTQLGGTRGLGIVFKLDGSGMLTVLHNFSGDASDGVFPCSGLVVDSSGNLYGTTYNGGGFGEGTVFKLDPSGTLTLLHSFPGGTNDGTNPYAGLVMDSSGNLYGTTLFGGASGYGTVFGIAPVTLSATGLDFGAVVVGTTSPAQTVTITNIGGGNFSYNSASLSGANATDFTLTYNTCRTAVAPGGTCSVTLSFTPNTASSELASLDLSQGGMTQTVSLTGTGAFPTATLSATGLTFPAQPVGATSSAQTLTVTNTSTVTLSITAVSITGDFAIASNTCTASVAAGQSCKVSITFSPKTTGPLTGTLLFTDNAAGSPQAVTLTGQGQDFSISAQPPNQTIEFANVTYNIALYPLGGFNQAVNMTCSGVPAHYFCKVQPASVTLDGANTTLLTLTVGATQTTSALPGIQGNFASLPGSPRLTGWFALLSLLGLIALAGIGRRNRGWGRVAPIAMLVLLVTLWVACNGSWQIFSGGTPPGDYTLTVKAASGSLSHSTTVSLTVR